MKSQVLESDNMVKEATNNQLIGLLLLRQGSLCRIGDDHPHRTAILAAKQSAEAELLHRLEKVEEYQQMAALACHHIDLLDKLSGSSELSAHVKRAKSDKDELINDPLKRRQQYSACCAVFSLPAIKR